MKISKRGFIELVCHESIVLNPYRDSRGVWTVGVGHTAAAGLPDPRGGKHNYSLSEVIAIFRRDVRYFEKRVCGAFVRRLNQSQFDAAVSFDFNTGAIERAAWVRHFNSGDIKKARVSFLNWRRPREIIGRRKKELRLFFEGIYSGDGWVNLYSADRGGRVLWGGGRRVRLPDIYFAGGLLARLTKKFLTNARKKNDLH